MLDRFVYDDIDRILPQAPVPVLRGRHTTEMLGARCAGWYGRGERTVEILSGTALWHHSGRLVPICYVMVRDVAGELRPQAFLCTDFKADPVDILR